MTLAPSFLQARIVPAIVTAALTLVLVGLVAPAHALGAGTTRQGSDQSIQTNTAEKQEAAAGHAGSDHTIGYTGRQAKANNNSGESDADDVQIATKIYMYAMGLEGDDSGDGLTFRRAQNSSCLSCSFLSYFMDAMTGFSKAVFTYTQNAFKVLVPISFLIWIGWQVAALMVKGGEDGRSFMYQLAGRMALFSVLWALVMAGSSGTPFLWKTIGPDYLEFTFDLASDIREGAMKTVASSRITDLGCADVQPIPGKSVADMKYQNDDTAATFIQSGIEVACGVERSHMVGVASGMAIIMTAMQVSGSDGESGFLESIRNFAFAFAGVLMKIGIGAGLMIIYALSAVWLVFLILDVVVRGLISAAFSPVIAALFLYKPTRGHAGNAIKALFGAMFTAAAISLVGLMAFFLVSQVTVVYENTRSVITRVPPAPDLGFTGSLPADFGKFIANIEGSGLISSGAVPMDFGAPWLYYMIFAGISTYALGKKLIAMLQKMIGEQGASAFADNALKMLRTGGMAGAGIAAFAGGAGIAATMRGGAGGSGRILGGAAQGGAGGLGRISDALMHASNGKNPFVGTDGSQIMGGASLGAEALRGNSGTSSLDTATRAVGAVKAAAETAEAAGEIRE